MPFKSLHNENHKITKEEIYFELNQILCSTLFSKSTVLTKFLNFIVKETLENRSETLKEYTIGVNALGKPEDFNPQIDAIVRIHAGRLRRLLNEYYLNDGKTNLIKIELVKGTYIPVFRTQIIESSPKKIPEQNNSISYSRSRLTIAVLPFRNLCPDNNYLYFSDGLGEELTRIFSTSPEISVIAHHSTLKYANALTDLRTIGAELGVHYIITGSVRRSSKEVRVNISLVETLNGTQIWSKNYTHTHDIDNTMEIQDHINNDVFSILSGYYGFIIKDKMKGNLKEYNKLDLESFDAILLNYHAQMTHSFENCNTARIALEKSLNKNPNNSKTQTVLALLYLDFYTFGYPNVDDPVNTAFILLEKAIKLAPQSPYTRMIFGWVNIYLDDKEKALEAFKYSLQLGTPSASNQGNIGFGLACAGEYKQAFILLKQSLELNPYCPWWYHLGFFIIHYENGDYQKALSSIKNMNVSEDVFIQPLLKVAVLGQLNMLNEIDADLLILNNKFGHITSNLRAHLASFLLDNKLIDEILAGTKKAGLVSN